MARLALALSLTLAACTSHAPRSEPAPPSPEEAAAPLPAPQPWPATFEAPAVLMASRIVVVGPEGLREHAAVMQDPAHHKYLETTTAEGFVRHTTLRPEVDYLAPIRCRLDGLQIFAERELVVLECPGSCELSIEAEGDVYYRPPGGGEEQRRDRLRLQGGPK